MNAPAWGFFQIRMVAAVRLAWRAEQQCLWSVPLECASVERTGNYREPGVKCYGCIDLCFLPYLQSSLEKLR